MVKTIVFLLSIILSFNNITIASYYAHEHHGKRTANNERFNMYALTAAHKVLKFGTKLKVTNLENEKSVIVRINDRGPFIKGRDLDLSYAAFKTISNPKVGKIKVKYEIVE